MMINRFYSREILSLNSRNRVVTVTRSGIKKQGEAVEEEEEEKKRRRISRKEKDT